MHLSQWQVNLCLIIDCTLFIIVQKSQFGGNGHRNDCVTQYPLSYFSTKTNVVGAQKNRLIETVLLNAQNIC